MHSLCWRVSFLILLCLDVSCLKRPLPSSKRTASVSSLGSDIKDAQTADAYVANLRCDEPETFRGFRTWRRLSNAEVRNTVSDIFKIADADFSGFPSDLPKKA